MSTNNNPHGHLNQSQAQNPSWNPLQVSDLQHRTAARSCDFATATITNPLQIPSYIPRQPQLAHMSNERPMVRSPLAWHAPTAAPPDSIYNFMSANHKNLEHQMNPILPPYVRGTTLFDSMDLSLQSARATTSPLNKAAATATPVGMPMLDYGLKSTTQEQQQHNQQQHATLQQQQQSNLSQLHNANNYPIHNLSMSSPSHIGQTAQLQQNLPSMSAAATNATTTAMVLSANNSPNVNANKYQNANGASECESMLPPLSNATTTVSNSKTNNNTTNNNNNNNNNSSSNASSDVASPVQYMSDAEAAPRLNEHFGKLNEMRRTNYEGEYPLKSMTKTEDLLTKDCNYLMSNKMQQQQPQPQVQMSPKKQSPIRNYHATQLTPTTTAPPTQQQQQPQQTQSSPYHSVNTAKRNGPHTPPNQSPTMLTTNAQQQQQQHSQNILPSVLQGNGSVNMEYNQLHANNYASQKPEQQQYMPTSMHTQPQQTHHNLYQQPQQQHQSVSSNQQTEKQQQQQPEHTQNASPTTAPAATNLQLLKTNAMPTTQIAGDENAILDVPAHKATTAAPAANTRGGSADSTSSSSSSDDDDDDDDSVDSSNSNHSRPRRDKSEDKSTSVESLSKTQLETKSIKTTSSPKNNLSQSSMLNADKTNCALPKTQMDVSTAETAKSTHENGVSSADVTRQNAENSNETANLSNKNCDLTANMLDSPKTKKQRQALKLRHAEHSNSNSNTSQIAQQEANNSSAVIAPIAPNDNAVSADDLCKEKQAETAQEEIAATTAPAERCSISPNSNSRSSSSSSSSSSCSNSSHSSCALKHKTQINLNAPTDMLVAADKTLPNATTAAENSDNLPVATTNAAEINDAPLNLHAKPQSPANGSFEEVENKLEEMFAGIEDEPAEAIEDEASSAKQTPAHDSESAAELNLALQLTTNSNSPKVLTKATADNSIETTKQEPKVPLPTKAAKKSTLPTPVHIHSPTHLSKNNVEQKAVTADNAAASTTPNLSPTAVIAPKKSTASANTKRMRTPRRLSVGIAVENIRITAEQEQSFDAASYAKSFKNMATKETAQPQQASDSNKILNDELPCTSAAAKLKEAARKSEEEATNAETKESPTKKTKQAAAKGNKRKCAPKAKAKLAAAASGSGNAKAAANKGNNKQKQQKAQRRRRNSSEEEDTNNSTRDANTTSSAPSSEPKYRSPFILVKNDGSVNVINAPTAEEAGLEKTGVKAKKLPAAKYTHDRKIRGLHSSTLSNKYDAETPDSSWICVFCKRGPHTLGLGDLFGPYLVSSDCEEYRTVMKLPDVIDVDAMFAAKRKRVDMVQTHPRNRPVVPATLAQQQQQLQISPTTSSGGRGKKKKKSMSEAETTLSLVAADANASTTNNAAGLDVLTVADIFLGMSKVSDNSYEVWLHEDCAVWAPDVFLVGARLTSLDSTVWNSARYHCELCSKTGATVCCLQRECKATAHAPCAKQAGWRLDESSMNVHCRRHVAEKILQKDRLGFISDTLNYLKTLQTINTYSNTLLNPSTTLPDS